MANEDKTNRCLILALSASSSQPSVTGNQSLVTALSAYIIQYSSTELVVLPPSSASVATGVTDNLPAQANIATIVQAFPETNVKLQRILNK